MKKIRKSFDFSDFLCSIKMKLLLGKWGIMMLILLGLPCIYTLSLHDASDLTDENGGVV